MMKMSRCVARRGSTIPSLGFLYLLLAHIVLPFASPFAVGTYASTTIAPHRGAATTSIRAAAGVEESLSVTNPLRKALSYLNPTSGRKNDAWKGAEYNATLPSRLLFSYASPLIDVASKRELSEEDAFHTPAKRKMGSAVQELSSIYQKCRRKAQKKIETGESTEAATLLKALLLSQRRTLILTGILRLMNTAVQAFPALLVARLLRLVESGDANPVSKSMFAALSLVGVLSVKMILENQYFHNVVNGATQVRGSLAGMIFDKSLRLPSGGGKISEDSKTSLGDGGVLNLMQSDASILESTAMQLHTIWDGPLQIAMYTTLLYRYLGPSVLWGIGVLMTVIPLNSITLRVLNRMRKKENEAKDARTKRTTEAISNMKLLKLQAWEKNFAEDIRGHREEELSRHSQRGVVRALNQAISNAVPALVLVVTLTAYAKSGRPIVASTIFTAISLFNQLRFPLFFYPMLIDSLANGRNAMKRISSYLSAEEIIPYVQTMPAINGGGSIEMKNGNFLWSSTTPSADGSITQTAAPALCDVSLDIKPGEVIAVVGSVGSGKTALVKSLLGELSPVPHAVVDPSVGTSHSESQLGILDKPTVLAYGNTAYCSQEAWLPKGTLREAVVFGREYDETRYMAALRDAGLDEDVADSMDGSNSKEAASRGVLSHETDVGEGGSNLSGGQRARVALARALYAGEDTKVFLLDDPLAALDAAVGSTVFNRLTARLRQQNAATLLVTNDPNIPRRCDRVILMGQHNPASPSCSTIIDIGTYDELLERGHDLRSLSSSDVEDEEADEDVLLGASDMTKSRADQMMYSRSNITIGYTESNCTIHTQHADPDSVECMKGLDNCISERSIPISPDIEDSRKVIRRLEKEPTSRTDESGTIMAEETPASKPTKKKLVSADDVMSKGAVPLSAYVTYLKSVRKPVLLVAMIFSYLMSNGAQFFQQYVVSKWTELGKADAMSAALGAQYLNSLVKAAGVVSVFLWLRSYLTMRVGIRASDFLHNKMLNSVFRAPMSFFDATPSGQLLSRFGKEMETVDSALPDGIGSVLFCFLQIGLSMSALAGVITPAMLIPLSLVGIFYGKTMGRFRPAARDLKRSESRTRSPVYTHFGEALRGKETIRSVPKAVRIWSSQHQAMTDQNLSVYYSVKALDRWLSIRLETLGNIIVFAAAVMSVFLTRAGKLKSGAAGWGLTQALSITGLLTWAVRTLTDLETHMMSMIRIQELTDLDSGEAKGPFENESSKMPTEKQAAGEALISLYKQPPNVAIAPTSDAALVASGWPWNGNIEFNNVSMRYNEISPLVLNDVSVTVPPGTTLGVVGRTGSGKSSLLLTLFRLVELEGGGNIKIDDIDIRSVSLQTLRESLSIIPQDPVLFAGTLLYNLDAMGKATQEDAWAALEAASPELANQFRSAGTGLETYISEGGKNLSSGQRQLICLARAMLRKSKILVMDEATSSVDAQTDAKVQETIRREFVDKGVTVMTVAHRLDTVLGYDKILVLGAGELVEYGSPTELLEKPNGEFRELVMQDRRNKRKGAATQSESFVTVPV